MTNFELSLYLLYLTQISTNTILEIFLFDTSLSTTHISLGGSDDKASAYNEGDPSSIPGSGRFPWRRKWQSTPVFLPRKSHGQRSLVAYSPWGCEELGMTEQLSPGRMVSAAEFSAALVLPPTLE